MLGSVVDLAWILGAVSVLLGLRIARIAWRGDAARVKAEHLRRCPKCRHELGNIPTRVCPECGREAKSESALGKPKRKRVKLAVGAAMVLVPGVVMPVYQWMKYGSWALVPDTLLILALPSDEGMDEWLRRSAWWSEHFVSENGAFHIWPVRVLPWREWTNDWYAPWQRPILRDRLVEALETNPDERELKYAAMIFAMMGPATAQRYEDLLGLAERTIGLQRDAVVQAFQIALRRYDLSGRGDAPPIDRIVGAYEVLLRDPRTLGDARIGIHRTLMKAHALFDAEDRRALAAITLLDKDGDFEPRCAALGTCSDFLARDAELLGVFESMIAMLPSLRESDRDALLIAIADSSALSAVFEPYLDGMLAEGVWEPADSDEWAIEEIRQAAGGAAGVESAVGEEE